MNKPNETKPFSSTKTIALTKMAMVTALYVVITLLLSVISFGAVQVRLSEMFNYLVIYDKRYIWAVTLGVLIANIVSPIGIVDMVVGSLSTLFILMIVRYVTSKMKNEIAKYMITAILCALSMFTIAGQLTIISGIPFWASYLTIGLGELLSMSFGGVIIYTLKKHINFNL